MVRFFFLKGDSTRFEKKKKLFEKTEILKTEIQVLQTKLLLTICIIFLTLKLKDLCTLNKICVAHNGQNDGNGKKLYIYIYICNIYVHYTSQNQTMTFENQRNISNLCNTACRFFFVFFFG